MMYFIRYFLTITISVKQIFGLVVAGVCILYIGYLSGLFSGRQTATVTTDIVFSLTRLTASIYALYALHELLGKSIDRKFILHLLAFPYPRWVVLFSAWLSIVAISFLFVIIPAMLLPFLVSATVSHEQVIMPNFGLEYWLTWLLMFYDISVVLTVGLFFTSFTKTPFVSLVFGILFYIIGHGYPIVYDYVFFSDFVEETVREPLKPVLTAISYVLPDLDSLDIRYSSLYQVAIDFKKVGYDALQVFVFQIMVILLAVGIFSKRDFV